jgi:ABC-2 type transport system permease protein
MTATTHAGPPATAAAAVPGRTGTAIIRHAVRRVRTGALVVALACGGSAWATAAAYAATYPTDAARREAAAVVGTDSGLRVLLGPIDDIATVGGYLVYKNFVFLTLLLAIWATLAATRLLRGEEDAGRWQLVLAAGARPARATADVLAALALAVGVILAGTTTLTLAAARDPALGLGTGRTFLYGASLALVPAVFAATGAVASQLAGTRRAANAMALGIIGATLLLRMVADTGPGARRLLWATPFGWTELMRPYTAPDAWPLVPAGLTVLVLATVATLLAGRRDVGQGLLAARDGGRRRRKAPASMTGLAVRLELPVLVAWCVGAAAAGLLLGVFARVTTNDVPASLRDNLAGYGVHGTFTSQFLGVAFLLVGTVVSLLPAGQVGAAAAEETTGRLTHLLAGPVRRGGWLLGRLAVAASATVAAALAGGAGVWLGARTQGLHLALPSMLGAGLNAVPTALVALGAGALVLALVPRAASWSVYAVVVWSVMADLIAPLLSGASWAQRLSLFHYMALVPGDAADPATLVAVTATGLLLCAAAVVLFGRRDLQPN